MEEFKTLKEDLKFLRDENTNLSIENAEIKYEKHNLTEEKNALEEKHSDALNEIYMLRKSLESTKAADRKLQSEFDSISKAYEHSKALVENLEVEKSNLQTELDKHAKDYMSGILTNLASSEKNKVMHQLSEFELDSLVKINKADIKSEFVQTAI